MERQSTGERSSLKRVREFLTDLENGEAEISDAEEIRDDLRTLVNRMERIQRKYPGLNAIDLSPEVRHLLKELNKNNLQKKFPFIKAASFL